MSITVQEPISRQDHYLAKVIELLESGISDGGGQSQGITIVYDTNLKLKGNIISQSLVSGEVIKESEVI